MELDKPYSIDKLRQYVGDDPDQIREMICLFLDTVPKEVIQIQNFANKKEWFEVYKLAHRIKPSFEVFAMDSILEDIKKIEHLARENNVEQSLDYYIGIFSDKLNTSVELLKTEL